MKSVHKGTVEFVEFYATPRIRIINLQPEHQVVEIEPTLIRNSSNFHYVFNSKKFGNMFFIKKKESFFNKLFN